MSDQILIPDFQYPYTISIGNLAIPKGYSGKTRLVGPIVTTRPNQIPYTQNEIRTRYGFTSSKPLVYIAVSGPRIERRYLAQLLEENIRNLTNRWQLVMSKGEASGSDEANKYGGILRFDWLDENTQYEMLKACDLIVSRAGHGLIMKAMTFGKPMILVPIPDHTEQYGNAKRSVILGFAKILDQDKINPESLSESIDEALVSKSLPDKAHQFSLFSGHFDAINEVARLILDHVKRRD